MSFPSAVQPEDFLEFHIYADECQSAADQPLDSDLHRSQLLFLSTLLDQLTVATEELGKGLIWQRDPLTFKIWDSQRPKYKSKVISATENHLWGRLHYGDNVDDEWIALWILIKLSISFRSLSIQYFDSSDGDFGMLEAFDVLPRWLRREIETFHRTSETSSSSSSSSSSSFSSSKHLRNSSQPPDPPTIRRLFVREGRLILVPRWLLTSPIVSSPLYHSFTSPADLASHQNDNYSSSSSFATIPQKERNTRKNRSAKPKVTLTPSIFGLSDCLSVLRHFLSSPSSDHSSPPTNNPTNPETETTEDSSRLSMFLLPQKVEEAALERALKMDSEKGRGVVNVWTVLMPSIAWILYHHPSLISDAIRSFCYRDPSSLRVSSLNSSFFSAPPLQSLLKKLAPLYLSDVRSSSLFPFGDSFLSLRSDRSNAVDSTSDQKEETTQQKTRWEGSVLVQVKMTQCLMAQLQPRPRQWAPQPPILSQPLSIKKNYPLPSPSSPFFSAFDMGWKICCGFEMLESSSRLRLRRFPSDHRCSSLLSLLQSSVDDFRSHLMTIPEIKEDLESVSSLSDSPTPLSSSERFRSNPPSHTPLLYGIFPLKDQLDAESDDSWLLVQPDQVDDLLMKSLRSHHSSSSSSSSSSTSSHHPQSSSKDDGEKFSSEMNGLPEMFDDILHFVKSSKSSFEGAEFPEDRLFFQNSSSFDDQDSNSEDEGDEFYRVGSDSDEYEESREENGKEEDEDDNDDDDPLNDRHLFDEHDDIAVSLDHPRVSHRNPSGLEEPLNVESDLLHRRPKVRDLMQMMDNELFSDQPHLFQDFVRKASGLSPDLSFQEKEEDDEDLHGSTFRKRQSDDSRMDDPSLSLNEKQEIDEAMNLVHHMTESYISHGDLGPLRFVPSLMRSTSSK